MEYLQRTADVELKELLESFGAVLIEGPKWCGKTTTAIQQSGSVIRLQDTDLRESYLATAAVKPSNLLAGGTPRLIDEWQDIPSLWDAVRVAVDDRGQVGQFILTGSNTVDRDKILHSGTGRIARMKMYPMSLYESRESSGEVSLKALFDNPCQELCGESSPMTIDDLIFACCRGGWPAALSLPTDKAKLRVASGYVDSLVEEDMSRIDGVKRNAALAKAILYSYSRNLSTLCQRSTMIKDISASFESCSPTTFDEYVRVLTQLFVIQDIEAWSPAVRSASAIRKGKKRNFVDPSIPISVLGLSPQMLQMDLKTFGFIFECLAIRDLRAYSQSLGGRISYYHDRYDLEADAVLHLNGGQYALIEFKLGGSEIDKGAAHLLKIKELVTDFNKNSGQITLREPDLLMVITGGPIAYTRKDGVHVVPLACLKD